MSACPAARTHRGSDAVAESTTAEATRGTATACSDDGSNRLLPAARFTLTLCLISVCACRVQNTHRMCRTHINDQASARHIKQGTNTVHAELARGLALTPSVDDKRAPLTRHGAPGGGGGPPGVVAVFLGDEPGHHKFTVHVAVHARSRFRSAPNIGSEGGRKRR